MNFKSLDLFSAPFFFYTENMQLKKGTYLGSTLSIMIFGLVFSYFVYLTNQYMSNQIDPKFRQQSFITEELTSIDLHEDLVGFRFEYQASKSLEELQSKQNKTYLVYYAVSSYSNKGKLNLTQLDIIECRHPKLIGFSCLDFSSLSNSTLFLSAKDNILNSLLILVYGCYDLDDIKTEIPDNCASQEEINDLFNGNSAGLRLKLYTSQYNTTSLQNQVNFRHVYIPSVVNSFIMQTLNIQKQDISVTQGYFIQSKSYYSSPIQYTPQSQIYNQINVTQIEVILQMDEIVQKVSVEYPYFPEILAVVNSTFALFMSLGIIGRYFAQKLILKDFLLLFLQNIYQDTYQYILQRKNLLDVQNTQILNQVNEVFQEQRYDEKESYELTVIPSIKAKFKESLETQSSTQKQEQNCTQKQDQNSNQKFDSVLGFENKSKANEKVENQAKCSIDISSREEYNFQTKDYLSQKNNFLQNNLTKYQDSQSRQILTQFKTKINQRQKYSNKKEIELINTSTFSPQCTFLNSKNTSSLGQNNILSLDQRNTALLLEQKNNLLSEQQSIKQSQQKWHSQKVEQQNGIQSNNQMNNHQIEQKNYKQDIISSFQRSSFSKLFMSKLGNYLKQRLKVMQDTSKLKQVYQTIFSHNISFKSLHPKQIWLKLCRKGKNDDFDQAKQVIQNQVFKSLNIFELFKDVILLKKAIMVLLSKDQLAALRLIGFSYDTYIQKDIENKQTDDDYQKKGNNYFEKQLKILSSDELQQKYLNKFLDKLYNGTELSEVDFRIVQSMNKNQIV